MRNAPKGAKNRRCNAPPFLFSFSFFFMPRPAEGSSKLYFPKSPGRFSRLLPKAVFSFPDAMSVPLPVAHNSLPGAVRINKSCLGRVGGFTALSVYPFIFFSRHLRQMVPRAETAIRKSSHTFGACRKSAGRESLEI